MSELTIGDVRDAVKRLAVVQEEKLRKYDEIRGVDGWKNADLFSLWTRILDEAIELHEKISDLHLALAKHSSFGAPIPKVVAVEVIRECADVSNFAAMIADEAHRLAELGDGSVAEELPACEPQVGQGAAQEPLSATEEESHHESVESRADPRNYDGVVEEVLECPSPISFTTCMEAALQECGWKVDPKIHCWVLERRRIAIEAVVDLRPQDAEFAKRFIDPQVVDLAMAAWKRVVDMGKDL